ncbi:MAG: chemotaxis protein CheD [Deltaproteobacteria bacterium]|nr:chemotaxis protein CheD [Deltaproteobacteria bacterium]
MNLIVGVSDMKVTNDIEATLVTYSLGSCIGVAIYDSVARVGGLLHYMLPESGLDQEKARKNPYMFADTGIPALFLDQKGLFNIGKRNDIAVRKMFHKNNVIIDYKDVGGTVNRTIKLSINTGDIWLKVSGRGEKKI